MNIDDIYAELKESSLCSSAYDFSTDYLGKSKSYYSVIKTDERYPSIESLLMLERVLLEKIQFYSNYDYQRFKEKKKKLVEMQKQENRIRKEQELTLQGYRWDEIEDILEYEN